MFPAGLTNYNWWIFEYQEASSIIWILMCNFDIFKTPVKLSWISSTTNKLGGLFKRRFCPYFSLQEKLGNLPTTRSHPRSGDHRLRTFGLCKVRWCDRSRPVTSTYSESKNKTIVVIFRRFYREWMIPVSFFLGGDWRWIYAYDMSYDIE